MARVGRDLKVVTGKHCRKLPQANNFLSVVEFDDH
jgi:hypothetical protein